MPAAFDLPLVNRHHTWWSPCVHFLAAIGYHLNRLAFVVLGFLRAPFPINSFRTARNSNSHQGVQDVSLGSLIFGKRFQAGINTEVH
jgi:hypothetical protein